MSMGLRNRELVFKTLSDEIGTRFYAESGEWKIESTSITTVTYGNSLAFFSLTFELRRLPGFFIINIVIPIVLMSFLNILVFIIPVDSGEKIGYGITVLLALTVFMSIVSDQLPRSSDTLPLVTIYLLVLTVISVCTVIVSILIVFFHHREEKEIKHQKATSNFKGMINKIKLMNRTASHFIKVEPVNDQTSKSSSSKNNPLDNVNTIVNSLKGLSSRSQKPEIDPEVKEEDNEHVYVNRWRQIGKYLDCISFVFFLMVWVSVTIGFLVEIAK